MLSFTLLIPLGDGAHGSHCEYRLYHSGVDVRGNYRIFLTPDERIINGIVTVGLIFTYFPKAHPRTQGQSKRQIIKDIDYIGGLLSITGLTLL